MTPTGPSANLPMPNWAMCGAPQRLVELAARPGPAPHRRAARSLWRWRHAQSRLSLLCERRHRAARPPAQPYRGDLQPPVPRCPWCWRCKIPPKSTGRRTPPPKAWGPWGTRACQGLLVHSTLAFTPERVPLGLLAQQVWARDPDDVGKRARRKQLPISQKESQKWLTSLEAVCSAHDGVSTDPLCQRWRPGSRCLRPAGGRAS